MNNENGYLYELPLMFIAYGIISVFLLPFLLEYLRNVYLALGIVMVLGLACAIFAGRSISEPRLRLWKIPCCVLSYIVISFATVPAILYQVSEKMAPLLLAFQAFVSFWLDLRLSGWYFKKGKGKS